MWLYAVQFYDSDTSSPDPQGRYKILPEEYNWHYLTPRACIPSRSNLKNHHIEKIFLSDSFVAR
jgi:hypothetical protein